MNLVTKEKTGLSNSQSPSHKSGILEEIPKENRTISCNGFNISIDNITITSNVTLANAERILVLAQAHVAETQIFKKYKDAFTFKMDVGNSNLYFSYDEQLEKKDINTFRVEFNPNNLNQFTEQWLRELVFPKFDEESVNISRIDIAFDTTTDLSNYRFVSRNTKIIMYHGQSGALETTYHGSSASERQCRLYNKVQERLDNNDEVIEEQTLWRFEVQLRHKKVKQWRHMVKNIMMVKNDFEGLNLQTKAMAEYLIKDPSGFDELSKNAKTKYRKILDEHTTSNLTQEIQSTINEVEDELSEMINSWVAGY